MDKKAKKKLQVLNQKIHQLELQLAGARKQNDGVSEIQTLEAALKVAQAQALKLKES